MVSRAVRTWVVGLNPTTLAASSPSGTARITSNPVTMTGWRRYAPTAEPRLSLRRRKKRNPETSSCQAPAQGVETFEQALALAGERTHEPLAYRAPLEAEAVEQEAGEQPTHVAHDRVAEKLAELLGLVPAALTIVVVEMLVGHIRTASSTASTAAPRTRPSRRSSRARLASPRR